MMNQRNGGSARKLKNRRGRSIAIAIALAAIVALIYAVTVFKLGANVMNRPL